jgi:hypothetical protein
MRVVAASFVQFVITTKPFSLAIRTSATLLRLLLAEYAGILRRSQTMTPHLYCVGAPLPDLDSVLFFCTRPQYGQRRKEQRGIVARWPQIPTIAPPILTSATAQR